MGELLLNSQVPCRRAICLVIASPSGASRNVRTYQLQNVNNVCHWNLQIWLLKSHDDKVINGNQRHVDNQFQVRVYHPIVTLSRCVSWKTTWIRFWVSNSILNLPPCSQEHDWRRAFLFTFFGATMGGPAYLFYVPRHEIIGGRKWHSVRSCVSLSVYIFQKRCQPKYPLLEHEHEQSVNRIWVITCNVVCRKPRFQYIWGMTFISWYAIFIYYLGGGFKQILFSLLLGEDSHFD